MSGLKYRLSHQVKGYECDFQGEMTLPSLINLMIHVSGLQSDSIGNTEASMSEKGLSWVIVQYNIDIHQIPRRRDQITIETEAMSYNRFFTYRAFRAYDENEHLLVEVLSTFSVMNLETRKLVRVQKEMAEPYEADEIRSIIRQPKIIPLTEENPKEQLFTVRYLDIDSNQHVNNSKYFDWLINTVDFNFLISHQIKKVQIKYEKEVGFGNVITSKMSTPSESTEDGTCMTTHQIWNEDTIACVATIFWKPRN